MEKKVSITYPEKTGLVLSVKKILAHRLFIIAVLLFAGMVTLPTINCGWIIDDIYLRLAFSENKNINGYAGIAQPIREYMDFFSFYSNKYPAIQEAKVNSGFYPWWHDKNLEINIFRPVSNFFLYVENLFFHEVPQMLHLLNLLFYFLAVIAAFFLYKELLGEKWPAGLAVLLFAINKCHFFPVIYLVNIHLDLALCSGILSILLYHYYLQKSRKALLFLAVSAFAFSVFSSEIGLSVLVYLFSYMLFLNKDTIKDKIVKALPFFIMLAVWAFFYVHFKNKVYGSEDYISPIYTPLEFILAALTRAPIYLIGLIPGVTVDYHYFISEHALVYFAAFYILVFLAILYFTRQLWLACDKCKFWLTGMLLAIMLLCTVFPDDRVLGFGTLGAVGFISQLFNNYSLKLKADKPLKIHPVLSKFCIFLVFILNLGYAVISFYVLPGVLSGMQAANLEQLHFGNDPEISKQEVVIMNISGINPVWGFFADLKIPARLRFLSPGNMEVALTRLDDYTLQVKPKYGYYPPAIPLSKEEEKKYGHFSGLYLTRRSERYFVNSSTRFEIGDLIRIEGVTIKVIDLTRDGRIAEVQFKFDTPLISPQRKWLIWNYTDKHYDTFALPAIKEKIDIM